MDILEMEVLSDDNLFEMEILNDTKSYEPEITFSGDYVSTLTKEQIIEAVQEYFTLNDVPSKSKLREVTLYADKWVGEEPKYEQIVTIEGVTETSQVNLAPSDEQLDIFYNKKVVLSTKNVGGVVTVTLIGQKLESDYTMQVTLVEVDYE
jgi:hypothetical protein